MGTLRLVKANAQAVEATRQPAPVKHFTNWSRQFLEEHLLEQASRLPAQVQFKALFKEEVN